MKKKILALVIVILLSFTIISCTVDKNPLGNYKSDDAYETKIIDSTSKLENSTVSVISPRVNSIGQELGGENVYSAVVVKAVKGTLENTYYALTPANVAKTGLINKIKIGSKFSNVKVTGFSYNEKYSFGILQFKSGFALDEVTFSKDNKSFERFIGQSIISVGTNKNLGEYNTAKNGFITDDSIPYNNLSTNKGDYFTHDAPINFGEIGSGVFDINGNLIGINIEKQYSETTESSEQFVLGSLIAVGTSRIATALNKIDYSKLNNSTLADSYFEEGLLEDIPYEKSELEKQINTVYNNNKKYVATIETSGVLRSGLVFDKTGNTYSVITKKVEGIENSNIILNDEMYTTDSYDSIGTELTILRFNSNIELPVYDSIAINDHLGIEIIKGQKLVSIGNNGLDYSLGLRVGNLSKDNLHITDQFMHDFKTRQSFEGAPIFNLNGELLGISLPKTDVITTNDGDLAAEGLSYAKNINYFAPSINDEEMGVIYPPTVKYASKVGYEKKIIDVIKTVDEKVVTISTNSGHGSGVIFKKENYNSIYRYYVLTNHHVVEGSAEITVLFNDERAGIIASDFQSLSEYDLGIVRFTSKDEYKVADISKALNDEILYSKGQTVISLGTPDNRRNRGYVTTGIVSSSPLDYRYSTGTKAIPNLGILQTSAINPGNSGGPVFNLNGELMALNVAKLRPFITSGGNLNAENVGYSLNINLLLQKANTFKPSNYIKLNTPGPRLGISVVEENGFVTNNPAFAEFITDANDVVIIVDVDEARLAYGLLQPFDIFYKMNGTRVLKNTDISNFLTNAQFGQKFDVEVLRIADDGSINIVKVVIELS